MFKMSKHIVIIIAVCTICIAIVLLCTAWLSFRRNAPAIFFGAVQLY